MPRTLNVISKALLLALAVGTVMSVLFRPSLLSRETADLARDLSDLSPDTRLARPTAAQLLTAPLTPSEVSGPDPRGPLGSLCIRRDARVFHTPPVQSATGATGFVSVRTALVLPFLLVVDTDGASTVLGPDHSCGFTHCGRAVLLVVGPWPIRLGSWVTGVMWHGPGRSASASIPAA